MQTETTAALRTAARIADLQSKLRLAEKYGIPKSAENYRGELKRLGA